MKLFECKIDLKKKRKVGVKAMSIVNKPAVEVDFIALSKEDPELKLALDKKQHKIYGPALIPNKKIYRTAESLEMNEEGYIFFSSETISKLVELNMANDLINKITLDHEDLTDGVKCIESWIIADKEKDKAFALGFDLPVGSWMLGYKVHDMKIWDRIEKGELNGFSIEATGIDLQEVILEEETAKTTKFEEEVDLSEQDLTEDEAAKVIVFKMLDLVVEPNPGEKEDEFISRCISEEIKSGYEKEQASAICFAKWSNKDK